MTPRHGWPVREAYLTFIDRHEVAWELAFAAFALVYVLVGFADETPMVWVAFATRPRTVPEAWPL